MRSSGTEAPSSSAATQSKSAKGSTLAGPPATLADGWGPPVIAYLPPLPPPARALAPPPPPNPPHPAIPARHKEGEITPRDSLSVFPRFSLSLSLGSVWNRSRKPRRRHQWRPDPPRRFPSPPAAFSPSRRYIIVPRASLLRFRHSPLTLPVGIVPAPSSSLSAVAAELRFVAVVAPDFLPTRRHLLRLRRVLANLVHPFVSPADCRSAAVLVDPNRAAAFLRSGCRFRRPRRPGVGPAVSRPRPRVRLTRGTHGADAAASEDSLFVEVEADVWESKQGKSHHP
uniref:HGWP repeat containing protein-like n=1 Tax=Oryza sativa subsp. japonica TaxID=39947 RepID=Q5VMV9_ORYSJ|nr:HGWP repeat containing protein-like [Oryza sativa Japonica Group]